MAGSTYEKIRAGQLKRANGIYSVLPPPHCLLRLQLQIICCYIARYYVKK